MDFGKLAELLHIEEKLRSHPHLKVLHDRVMQELKNHNAFATREPPTEVVLTKAEEETKVRAEESRALAEKQEAERLPDDSSTPAKPYEDLRRD